MMILKIFSIRNFLALSFLTASCLTLEVQPTFAQITPPGSAPANESSSPPPDSLRRENPREAFENFVKAMDTGNFQKASQYLQALPGKKPEEIKTLVNQFRALLDRGYVGTLDSISDEPLGNLADGLNPDEESAGDVVIATQKLEVKLVKIKTKAGRELWFISKETLQNVPTFHAKIGPTQVPAGVPALLVEKRIWNAPLYIWLVALLLIPVLFGISWLLVQSSVFLVRIIKKIFHRPLKPFPFNATLPFVILLTILCHYIFMTTLGLPILSRHYYAKLLTICVWLGMGWLAFNFAEALMQRYLRRLIKKKRFNTHSMMTLGRKLLKAGILIFLALAILNTLGFKINAALAGLGIGGLALALAAQKSIENLFGGLGLLTDQVIRVGDFCKIGDQVGTVEDVSLRSTRIRTLDRAILYVPNGTLSVENLKNFSQRDKFWFQHFLGLRYESTAQQIREILKNIQNLFENHEKVETSSAWVRFVRMGTYSLDLELFAYLQVRSQEEHLQFSEELLLQCMDIVEKTGTGFAFPSQTTYLTQDNFK